MEAVVDGGCSDDGPHQWQLLTMEAALGWRDDDTMALAMMVLLADGGSGNGGHHCQLCSGS